jgi:hypothetical protein
LYSEESIFELIVKNEGRDIWKVYLARKDFEKALSHVDVSTKVMACQELHATEKLTPLQLGINMVAVDLDGD